MLLTSYSSYSPVQLTSSHAPYILFLFLICSTHLTSCSLHPIPPTHLFNSPHLMLLTSYSSYSPYQLTSSHAPYILFLFLICSTHLTSCSLHPIPPTHLFNSPHLMLLTSYSSYSSVQLTSPHAPYILFLLLTCSTHLISCSLHPIPPTHLFNSPHLMLLTSYSSYSPVQLTSPHAPYILFLLLICSTHLISCSLHPIPLTHLFNSPHLMLLTSYSSYSPYQLTSPHAPYILFLLLIYSTHLTSCSLHPIPLPHLFNSPHFMLLTSYSSYSPVQLTSPHAPYILFLLLTCSTHLTSCSLHPIPPTHLFNSPHLMLLTSYSSYSPVQLTSPHAPYILFLLLTCSTHLISCSLHPIPLPHLFNSPHLMLLTSYSSYSPVQLTSSHAPYILFLLLICSTHLTSCSLHPIPPTHLFNSPHLMLLTSYSFYSPVQLTSSHAPYILFLFLTCSTHLTSCSLHPIPPTHLFNSPHLMLLTSYSSSSSVQLTSPHAPYILFLLLTCSTHLTSCSLHPIPLTHLFNSPHLMLLTSYSSYSSVQLTSSHAPYILFLLLICSTHLISCSLHPIPLPHLFNSPHLMLLTSYSSYSSVQLTSSHAPYILFLFLTCSTHLTSYSLHPIPLTHLFNSPHLMLLTSYSSYSPVQLTSSHAPYILFLLLTCSTHLISCSLHPIPPTHMFNSPHLMLLTSYSSSSSVQLTSSHAPYILFLLLTCSTHLTSYSLHPIPPTHLFNSPHLMLLTSYSSYSSVQLTSSHAPYILFLLLTCSTHLISCSLHPLPHLFNSPHAPYILFLICSTHLTSCSLHPIPPTHLFNSPHLMLLTSYSSYSPVQLTSPHAPYILFLICSTHLTSCSLHPIPPTHLFNSPHLMLLTSYSSYSPVQLTSPHAPYILFLLLICSPHLTSCSLHPIPPTHLFNSPHAPYILFLLLICSTHLTSCSLHPIPPTHLFNSPHLMLLTSYSSYSPVQLTSPHAPYILFLLLTCSTHLTSCSLHPIPPTHLFNSPHLMLLTSYSSYSPVQLTSPHAPYILFLLLICSTHLISCSLHPIPLPHLVNSPHLMLLTSYSSYSPVQLTSSHATYILTHLNSPHHATYILFLFLTCSTHLISCSLHPIPPTHLFNSPHLMLLTSYSSYSPVQLTSSHATYILFLFLICSTHLTSCSLHPIPPTHMFNSPHLMLLTSYSSVQLTSSHAPYILFLFTHLFNSPHLMLLTSYSSSSHLFNSPHLMLLTSYSSYSSVQLTSLMLLTSYSSYSSVQLTSSHAPYILFLLLTLSTHLISCSLHPIPLPHLFNSPHLMLLTSYSSYSSVQLTSSHAPYILFLLLICSTHLTSCSLHPIPPTHLFNSPHLMLLTSYSSYSPVQLTSPHAPYILFLLLTCSTHLTSCSLHPIPPTHLFNSPHLMLLTSYSSYSPVQLTSPHAPYILFLLLTCSTHLTSCSLHPIPPTHLFNSPHLMLLTSYSSSSPVQLTSFMLLTSYSSYSPVQLTSPHAPYILFLLLTCSTHLTSCSLHPIPPTHLFNSPHLMLLTSYSSYSPVQLTSPHAPYILFLLLTCSTHLISCSLHPIPLPHLFNSPHLMLLTSYSSYSPVQLTSSHAPYILFLLLICSTHLTSCSLHPIPPTHLFNSPHLMLLTSYSFYSPVQLTSSHAPYILFLFLTCSTHLTSCSLHPIPPTHLFNSPHLMLLTSYSSSSPVQLTSPHAPYILFLLLICSTHLTSCSLHPIPLLHLFNSPHLMLLTSYSSYSSVQLTSSHAPYILFLFLICSTHLTSCSLHPIPPTHLFNSPHLMLLTSYSSSLPVQLTSPHIPYILFLLLTCSTHLISCSLHPIPPTHLFNSPHLMLLTSYSSYSPVQLTSSHAPYILFLLLTCSTHLISCSLHPIPLPHLFNSPHLMLLTSYSSYSSVQLTSPHAPYILFLLLICSTHLISCSLHPIPLPHMFNSPHLMLLTSYSSYSSVQLTSPHAPYILFLLLICSTHLTSCSLHPIPPTHLFNSPHLMLLTSYSSYSSVQLTSSHAPYILFLLLTCSTHLTSCSLHPIPPTHLFNSPHLMLLTSYSSYSSVQLTSPHAPYILFLFLTCSTHLTSCSLHPIPPTHLFNSPHLMLLTSYTSSSPCQLTSPHAPYILFLFLICSTYLTLCSLHPIPPTHLFNSPHLMLLTSYSSYSPVQLTSSHAPYILFLLLTCSTHLISCSLHPIPLTHLFNSPHLMLLTSYSSYSPVQLTSSHAPYILFLLLTCSTHLISCSLHPIPPTNLFNSPHLMLLISYSFYSPVQLISSHAPYILFLLLTCSTHLISCSLHPIPFPHLFNSPHLMLLTSYSSYSPVQLTSSHAPYILFLLLTCSTHLISCSLYPIPPTHLFNSPHLMLLTSYSSYSSVQLTSPHAPYILFLFLTCSTHLISCSLYPIPPTHLFNSPHLMLLTSYSSYSPVQLTSSHAPYILFLLLICSTHLTSCSLHPIPPTHLVNSPHLMLLTSYSSSSSVQLTSHHAPYILFLLLICSIHLISCSLHPIPLPHMFNSPHLMLLTSYSSYSSVQLTSSHAPYILFLFLICSTHLTSCSLHPIPPTHLFNSPHLMLLTSYSSFSSVQLTSPHAPYIQFLFLICSTHLTSCSLHPIPLTHLFNSPHLMLLTSYSSY